MATDHFEVWLAEKIWELVPPHYRHEDGVATPPDVLRSVVEVMARQGALLRRSQDRLWEDQFIELCDDWAVPYIGDLLNTRLVSALNTRGRRVDVAKTIHYRRRAGTLRVMEELVRDITGWEGKVVESFRRLARARHGLDPLPAPLSGRRTRTPPGGFADLRRPAVSDLIDGPFDELHHLPDARRHRGRDGRVAIPKLAFHLYRLRTFRMQDVVPRVVSDGAHVFWTFDPSGRGVPLFVAPYRAPSWDDWRSAREWELPAPMSCRLLGHAEYMVTQTTIAAVAVLLSAPQLDSLRTLQDVRFRDEQRFVMTLDTLSDPPPGAVVPDILQASRVDECGKSALLSPVAPVIPSLRIMTSGAPIAPDLVAAGDITDPLVYASLNKQVVVDPAKGRLLLLGPVPSPTTDYHYGFSGPIGAGPYERPGLPASTGTLSNGGPVPVVGPTAVIEVLDNRTYGPLADQPAITDLTFQARNGTRPYLEMLSDWTLTSAAPGARLTLDGLWIGVSGGDRVIFLQGDFEEVVLRSVTLDPGGLDAGGNIVSSVILVVAGHVERLTVQGSILGRIRTTGAGTIDTLDISDSILHAPAGDILAIVLERGEVHLERVTVLGGLQVHRLWASEALLAGDPTDPTALQVADVQGGCVRYSAYREGGQLPRRYASFPFVDSEPLFTSRAFGDPGYAQLAAGAPPEILRGAENGSEIGAFSSLVTPIKLDGLAAKVTELMPFGLTPLFIFET